MLFFKRKTEYGVRVSVWSSDVCSSDVPARNQPSWSRGRSSDRPMPSARGGSRTCGGCPRSPRHDPALSLIPHPPVDRARRAGARRGPGRVWTLSAVPVAVADMKARVKGRRIPAAEDIDVGGKPGDFQFTALDYAPTDDPVAVALADDRRWVRFEWVCPAKGTPCGGILVGYQHKPQAGAPTWQWDGNVEAPTLTPSINCVGGGT